MVELEAVRSEKGKLPDVEGVVLYARVSSQRQRAEGDLDRQMARLRKATAGRPVVGEFFDVASGLSDQRRGLCRALTLCQRPEVAVLLVEHEERLARFGTGVIRDVMLPALGVAVEVTGVDEDVDASQESELVRDMLAVVTSLAGRLYGQRSAKARALTKCVKSTIAQPDWVCDTNVGNRG